MPLILQDIMSSRLLRKQKLLKELFACMSNVISIFFYLDPLKAVEKNLKVCTCQFEICLCLHQLPALIQSYSAK